MIPKKGRARRIFFWATILVGTALLFCWARNTAMIERGYHAAGGEWLVWLLPVFVWWKSDMVRALREIAAEERREEERTE